MSVCNYTTISWYPFQVTFHLVSNFCVGGTDPSISNDLLKANGIEAESCSGYQQKINESFKMLPEIVKKGIDDERWAGAWVDNALLASAVLEHWVEYITIEHWIPNCLLFPRYCWKVLPNVHQLLDSLALRSDVKLALLTGGYCAMLRAVTSKGSHNKCNKLWRIYAWFYYNRVNLRTFESNPNSVFTLLA